jgi:hypothetical protein
VEDEEEEEAQLITFQSVAHLCFVHRLGSWWVYCSIETISSSNVWIDFAKITLVKLCVRTCCIMRSHEHVDKLSSP